SEEHTSELQSLTNLVCRLLLEKKIRDVADDNWFNVRWTGFGFDVNRTRVPFSVAMVKVETTSNVLEVSIDNDWGGDAFVIGYGCDVTIVDQRSSSKANLCVALLTRYPRERSYMARHPIRLINCLYQSAPMFMTRLSKKIRSQLGDAAADEDELYSQCWLTSDIEAIRKNYRLPDYLW